jgi:hypothetical protein
MLHLLLLYNMLSQSGVILLLMIIPITIVPASFVIVDYHQFYRSHRHTITSLWDLLTNSGIVDLSPVDFVSMRVLSAGKNVTYAIKGLILPLPDSTGSLIG